MVQFQVQAFVSNIIPFGNARVRDLGVLPSALPSLKLGFLLVRWDVPFTPVPFCNGETNFNASVAETGGPCSWLYVKAMLVCMSRYCVEQWLQAIN